MKIHGPSGEVTADVVDTKDGRYVITYKAPSTGKYKISVLIDGKDIRSSPFTQDVK